MRNILFITIVVFFIVGCSSKIKRLELEPYAKLEIPSISINTPSSFPKDEWTTYGDYLYDSGNVIQLFRRLPNMMSEDVRITVRAVPTGEKGMYGLLNKDNLEKRLQEPPTEWEKKNLAERGVGYYKWYVDYIGNLKCSTHVEGANIALGVGRRKYNTYCAYYDNSGITKEIYIDYDYTYAHSNAKHDGDKSSSVYSPQAMQKQFKEDMRAIFDSLVIHDMDRELMNKAGLLHDRKYDTEKEFR
jgi:hypothetical protein